MVWLVAENISDSARAADVWMHEQVVHGGLRSLFGQEGAEKEMRQLWIAVDGMENADVAEIARRYGLDPRTDLNARARVMEEYLASLAEKQRDDFTPQEHTVWQRIVQVIVDMWNRIAEAVNGKASGIGATEVDALLSTLGRYVMDVGQIEDGRLLYQDQKKSLAWARTNRLQLPKVRILPSRLSEKRILTDADVVKPLERIATAKAPFFYDDILPSLRTDPAPVKTVTAYKLFRVRKDKPGKLFPLFVSADGAVDMGVWLDAEIGASTADGKVKSKLGGLAMRPGWHAGDTPIATHIGDKQSKEDTAPSLRPENQVWAEVEAADDIGWQEEATRRAQTTKDGTLIARTAHITDQIPKDGLYRYKTNPNMTGTWIITGSMKVNRVLSDADVEKINTAQGVADLPRLTPFDAEKYGFSEEHFRTQEAATQQVIEKEIELSTESQVDLQTPSESGTSTFKKTPPVNGFAGVYSDILKHLRNTANETDTDAEEDQLAPM